MGNKIIGTDSRPIGVTGTQPVARVRDAASGAAAESTAIPQEVRITDGARQLAALEQAIAQLPVVNAARVEAVAVALERGQYRIDADQIADRLIRTEADLTAAARGNSAVNRDSDLPADSRER